MHYTFVNQVDKRKRMRTVLLLTLLSGVLFAKQSLSLEDILIKIQNNNAQLAIDDINIRQATLKKDQAGNQRFGSVSLKAGYTTYDQKRTLTPLAPPISPNTPTSQNIATATVAYNVTLFDGFATPSNIQIADISSNQAQLGKKLTLAQLRYNATSLYLKALAVKASIQSNEASIKSLQNLYNQRKRALQIGKSSELELLKVQTSILSQTALQDQLHYNLHTIKLQLQLMMGLKDNFTLKQQSFAIKEVQDSSDISQTLTLQNAQKSVQKSKKQVQKAKANYYPKLYFETFHTNAYASEGDDSYYQGGIYLSWNLFDFGVRKNELEVARLEQLKASSSLEQIYDEHESKIIQTKAQIQKNKTLLQAKEQELMLAQKIEAIEKVKFDNGAATIQDLLDYKAQTLSAQTASYEAKYELLNALYYYEFLTTKDI